MRVELLMSTSENGTLTGTATWADGSVSAPFHGTLELLALLSRAVRADVPAPSETPACLQQEEPS